MASAVISMFLCTIWAATNVRGSIESFSHEVELDTEGKVFLSWTIKQDIITMELVVEALGYIAVGFSPSGGMRGADIAMAWVKGNEVFFKDMYAEGTVAPTEDPYQDYELVTASQNGTHTRVSFKREMKTCDRERDLPLSDDTVRVIWAYSDQDEVVYHGPNNRGSRSVYLMSTVQTPWKTGNLDQYKKWNVSVKNLALPPLSTVYWCKIFRVPKTTTKHQIIGYAADITKGNEAHVHHFLFYQCNHPQGLEEETFNKYLEHDGHVCYGPNMPMEYMLCRITLLVWAIGNEGEMYPENVGAPLGSEFGGFDYYMLEVHYDNPLEKEGIVDNSGMQILYTDKLREYDSSTLELGHPVTPTLVVPPGQPTFTTVTFCDDSCTKLAIPPEGIRVFQALLHAHTFGRAIKARHFRDGKELEPIIVDNHYDFNYQQSRALKPERVILPGDKLQVECIYNTEGRKIPVYGGLATEDEMCLVYLTYYPKIALGKCQSVTNPADIAAAVGVEYPDNVWYTGKYVGLRDFFFGGVFSSNLKAVNTTLLAWLYGGVDWNDAQVAKFQSTVAGDKKHYSVCLSAKNTDILDKMPLVDIPTKDIGTKYGIDAVTPATGCIPKLRKNWRPLLTSFLQDKYGFRLSDTKG